MVEQLGYSDVSSEIVDNNSNEEKELVEEINNSLTSLQYENLAENELEKLNKDQLSAFLTKNYFEGGTKSYSECRNSGQILSFSMKAALQLLSENNTKKFDNNGNETNSDDGMTATELLKSRGGIDLDNDNVLIKVLQNIVGAHPDGKPGPQTIALVISALGGDISNIYEGVNDIYNNNEKFKVKNINTFKIGETDYKYDKNQFHLTEVGGKYILTINGEQQGKEITLKEGKPTLAGFTFENGWIKRGNTNSTPNTTNTPDNNSQQNDNPKHDENPKIPENWDDNVEIGKECTQETSNFIHNNSDKLSFNETNKKEYLSLLDNILNDGPKSATFYSFIKLDNKFWKNYRLTYNDLKNFNDKAGTNKGRGFYANKNNVFHETNADNFSYYTYRDNKIIKQNEGSGYGNTFEVSGPNNYYRFDSVECFCKYMDGVNIETARKNVNNLTKEKNDISYRSEKFKSEVFDKTATLRLVGFGDDSDNGLKKRKTFISLLELPERFWGNYKLNEKDINNFAKGMKEDIFDRGNATVFHTEGLNKKKEPVFEVDGSASSNHRSDRHFTSVQNFFYKLDKRISTGERPK